MSAIVAAIVTGVAAMAAGVGYSIYAGEQGKKAQEDAMRKQEAAQAQARQQAERQATESRAAIRRQERQTPNIAGIMQAAQQTGTGGPASTMLTGPAGIDPAQLQLGRNTLLGS
jgi:uncharacterized protein HemX